MLGRRAEAANCGTAARVRGWDMAGTNPAKEVREPSQHPTEAPSQKSISLALGESNSCALTQTESTRSRAIPQRNCGSIVLPAQAMSAVAIMRPVAQQSAEKPSICLQSHPAGCQRTELCCPGESVSDDRPWRPDSSCRLLCRKADIHPDQSVIGSGDVCRSGCSGGRPEHAGLQHLQLL